MPANDLPEVKETPKVDLTQLPVASEVVVIEAEQPEPA